MALERGRHRVLQGTDGCLPRRFMREGREVSTQEVIGLSNCYVDRVPVTSGRNGGGCQVVRREPGAESGRCFVGRRHECFDLESGHKVRSVSSFVAEHTTRNNPHLFLRQELPITRAPRGADGIEGAFKASEVALRKYESQAQNLIGRCSTLLDKTAGWAIATLMYDHVAARLRKRLGPCQRSEGQSHKDTELLVHHDEEDGVRGRWET